MHEEETLGAFKATAIEEDSQFADDLEDRLSEYNDAANTLRAATRDILSDESIAQFARAYSPDYDDNDRGNRRREDQTIRRTADIVKHRLVNAKLWAQVYTDPDVPEDRKAEAINYRVEPEQSEDGTNSFQSMLDGAWSRVFDAEVERSLSEQAIRSTIDDFLSSNPSNVIDFIEIVLQLDPHEYRELLALLYKDREDEMIAELVGGAIRDLGDHPEVLADVFLSQLDNSLSTSTCDEEADLLEPETRSWLGWIASHDLIATPPSKLLHSQPPADWPTALQASLDAYAHGYLKELWDTYIQLTDQFANKSIFYVKLDDLSAIHQKTEGESQPRKGTKKRRNSKGSRTTTKANADAYLETQEEESTIVFDSVATVAKTPKGWLVKDEYSLEDAEPAETLIEIPLVAKYLSKYESDPTIRTDVVAMLDSILRTPHHNGAGKLVKQTINVWAGSQAKDRPVWHLNPNKRPGLSIGNVGRETRIFYAIHPDRERKQLLLLDIAHKNGATNLTNTAFRRTS